jgi:hypothetical protein
MKRILLLSIMFFFAFCTLESCMEETDQSKCNSHSIEIDKFQCFIYEDPRGDENCYIYTKDAKLKNILEQYSMGMFKERLSLAEDSEIDKGTFTLEKNELEASSKGDIIKNKEISVTLTESEKEKLKKRNTCSYQIGGRFIDEINPNPSPNFNISNKSLCFNVDRFDELKDLVDCGYSLFLIEYMHLIIVMKFQIQMWIQILKPFIDSFILYLLLSQHMPK